MHSFDEWYAMNPELFGEDVDYNRSVEIRAAWLAAGQGHPDQVMDQQTFTQRLAATMEYLEFADKAMEQEDEAEPYTAAGGAAQERRVRADMVVTAVHQEKERQAVQEAVAEVRREKAEELDEIRKEREERQTERDERMAKEREEDEKAHPGESAMQRDARRRRDALKRQRERHPERSEGGTLGAAQGEQEIERQEQSGERGQPNVGQPGSQPGDQPAPGQQYDPSGGRPNIGPA